MDIDLDLAISTAAPQADLETWRPALEAAFGQWDITTPRRVSVALGQFAAEAGQGFREIVENLNYTTPARIAAVWPSRFRSAADAAPFARNPEALANRVYSGKLGNGDEASGDGWRFIGRGLIQLTGRSEYADAAEAFGMTPEAVADWAATPEGAAQTGCWYLSSRGCLPLADTWRVSAVTRLVNGAAMLNNEGRVAVAQQVLQAVGEA
jgi:predicted chitinase